MNAVKGHYPGPLDEPSMFLVETTGVEPVVPEGGGFTVHWGYQFSYISKTYKDTLAFLMSLLAMSQPNVFIYALRSPAVIVVYQKFRQVASTSLFITYTFHPLPDRDRSRIANAGLVGPLIAQ